MKSSSSRCRWLFLIAMVCSGCSQLTEWYACGVNCQYHPRPPLPYQQYAEGVCHSHVVFLPRQTLRPETGAATQDADGKTKQGMESQEPEKKSTEEKSRMQTPEDKSEKLEPNPS